MLKAQILQNTREFSEWCKLYTTEYCKIHLLVCKNFFPNENTDIENKGRIDTFYFLMCLPRGEMGRNYCKSLQRFFGIS